MTISHPAKYSEPLYAMFEELLPERGRVLDPFAGVGGIHRLARNGRATIGVELEPEWARAHRDTIVGDARELPFDAESFDAICTSPTYGNRMADTYRGDGTPRHTYTIAIDRDLTEGNSGAMQWGPEYRAFHEEAWAEAVRVLAPRGAFVLNVKDHIRKGTRVPVSGFHVRALEHLGLYVSDVVAVPLAGNRHGANGDLRVGYELVIAMVKL